MSCIFFSKTLSLLSVKLPTDISGAFKRPVSVHRNELQGKDKKFDMVYTLQHLTYHFKQLKSDKKVEDMELFLQCKLGHVKPGEGFFFDKVLPISTYFIFF